MCRFEQYNLTCAPHEQVQSQHQRVGAIVHSILESTCGQYASNSHPGTGRKGIVSEAMRRWEYTCK